MRKLPQFLLICAAVLLVGLTLVRAGQSWRNDSHLDHVAGAWTAMALDLRHGIFYRAPFGPAGYGGTRFFPLYFSLHAALLRIVGWRAAGYFLSSASIVLLLAGVYVLLRRLGTGRWLAAAAVLATLAGSSVQDALLTIREDGMAAMFSVWGLALCVGREPSRRRIYLAALLFSLAFATKESSVSAAGALFLSFILAKRIRAALHFLGATSVGYAVVMAAMYLASSGRAFAAFRFTLATGSSLSSLLYSPVAMVQMMHGYVAETVLLVLGLAALIATSAQGICRIASLWFVCALGVTLVIFSSDGTAGNHLMELHIAAVVMFVTWASDVLSPEAVIAVLAAACMLAWTEVLGQHAGVDAVPMRAQLQQIVEAIGPTDKPILADDPLVPITAGQQPYVLDAFMLRVIREHDPSFSDPLWQKLRQRQFAAVVLLDNPDSDEGSDTYSNYHFGDDFVPLVEENYQPGKSVGGQYVFLPKASPAP